MTLHSQRKKKSQGSIPVLRGEGSEHRNRLERVQRQGRRPALSRGSAAQEQRCREAAAEGALARPMVGSSGLPWAPRDAGGGAAAAGADLLRARALLALSVLQRLLDPPLPRAAPGPRGISEAGGPVPQVLLGEHGPEVQPELLSQEGW